ncbi:hypothetical protein AWM75_02290 [Aerococcus urinaehominis]|uniref:Glutamate racemase n=1 Tax=Aerococcus urinaehominis TaxID=128944 RepID=A0A120IAR4_9LACT|nr:glutamate racemase [Aerococcus urinaehominis]AMB98891.1 hypothetical protein AWM75_02290 [Aerococcus urinaehominis]SDM15741.1 glutamate racemase [Aerococcus urinaehominis]
MQNNPIGFIDSGVGGLTVLKAAKAQLGQESLIYFGDNARCPYGPRPADQILTYVNQIVDFLLTKQIKLLVIACNTATAVTLNALQARLDIPVVGVIMPGVKAALAASQAEGRIGIIATEGTINSQIYQELLLDQAKDLKLYPLACPEFVDLVEERQVYSSDQIQTTVSRKLADLKKQDLDALILGCTHFPLIEKEIGLAVGNQVQLINSGREAIKDVKAVLNQFNLRASDNHLPSYHYYTSGDVGQFKSIAQAWLGDHIHVDHIDLKNEMEEAHD